LSYKCDLYDVLPLPNVLLYVYLHVLRVNTFWREGHNLEKL